MARARKFDPEESKARKFTETISFNYLVEGLEMGVEEAERIKNIELRNLQSRRKLCLVLDLDHTLIHTKVNNREGLSFSKCEDIYEWKLVGDKYFTKLRPFVRQFLNKASEMFELYVYTMGTRDYASHIVKFLDPDGVYFGKRVISREDCSVEGKKGLDVVPVHQSGVLILDDTESVWNNLGNLILVEEYNYFQGSREAFKDESEGAGVLSAALEKLRKLHSFYFDWYDLFMEGDVRELLKYYWEDIVDDEEQQEVETGPCSSVAKKRLRLDDECSSVAKKQRIC